VNLHGLVREAILRKFIALASEGWTHAIPAIVPQTTLS